MKAPSYDLRVCAGQVVIEMCEQYHGYGGAGCAFTYAFAVCEEKRVVAAYGWQPPAPGAALAVCPEAPQGVLALSRMVAVPKEERELNHVSKPLRRQMKMEIDRERWPVLITYHDESQGHTGHVYKCSGWKKTTRSKVPIFKNADGVRRSRYSGGKKGVGVVQSGWAWLQRWEHWACEQGKAAEYMEEAGWRRVPLPGKVWASGNQAYTWKREGVLK